MLIGMLVMTMFLVSTVSAFNFDNRGNKETKTFNGNDIAGNKLLEKYPPITIKNAFGFGVTLFEGYLSDHDENCEIDCSSTIQIKIPSNGSLIDSIIFETKQDDNSWVQEDVRKYKLLHWELVDVVEEVCENRNVGEAGSKQLISYCENQITGQAMGWAEFDEGTIFPAGEHTVKIEAEKKSSRTVDWKIETQGVLIDDWAVWGGLFEGSEYQLIIPTTEINEGALEINGVLVTEITPNVYKINTTNANDEISRALIMKTLFYGTNGNDPRATPQYVNATEVYSNDVRDSGKRGTFSRLWYSYSGGLGADPNLARRWTGTFADTSTNFDVSTWSYVYGQGYSFGSSNEIGTNTSADEINNPSTVELETKNWASFGYARFEIASGTIRNQAVASSYATDFARSEAVILHSGNITWANATYIYTPLETYIATDFYLDEGFPIITYSEARVILENPSDGYISSTPEVNLSCSAEVTGGATLVNISLWSNSSGSWGVTDYVNASLFGLPTHKLCTQSKGECPPAVADWTNEDNFFDGNSGTHSLTQTSTGFRLDDWLQQHDLGKIWNSDMYVGDIYIHARSRMQGDGGDDTFSNVQLISYNGTDWNSVATLCSSGTLGTADCTTNGIYSFNNITQGLAIRHWGFNYRVTSSGYYSAFAYRMDFNVTELTTTFQETLTGDTLWSCQACDSDGDCGISLENRTVFLDNVAPTINISSPTSKLNFGKQGEIIDLNYTITDTNLESCWYEFDGVNTTIPCNGTTTTFVVNSLGDNELIVWANDSVSNLGSQYINWTYFLWQDSATFNAVVGEVSDETFNTNLTLPDGDSITSAKFIYNGTEYSPDINLYTGGALLSYDLATPNVVVSTNFTFNWKITINPIILTTPETQTVIAVNMDDCSTFTDLVLNFTLVDEVTEALITGTNSSIEVDVTLTTVGGAEILQFYQIYNNTPYAEVCMEELLNDTTYQMDVVTSYVADGYVEEFWFLDDGVLRLNNWSLNDYVNKNVTLRDLPLDDSTTFLFKYLDEFYAVHQNSVVTAYRYYIGQGVYKPIERCQLDSNGECHLHLVEEDVIYQFLITDLGQFEFLSGEYNAKCLSTICSITLRKSVTGGVWDDQLDNLDEGTYSVSSDKTTREVSVAFNLEETGTMALEVYEYDNSAEVDVLVASDSVVAKSGVASTTIPLSYGNKTYYAVVKHNTGFVTSEWVDMNEDGYKYFGNLGLFLGALLILTLGLIAVSSGGWTVAFLLLGMVVASVTKLVDMGFYLLMWVVSAGALLVWKLSTRRSI